MRADDLVKTPVSHDMGALRRCNPPASRCSPEGCGPPLAREAGPILFFNVEYPDLCGTTRILSAKIQKYVISEKRKVKNLLVLGNF